MSLTLHLGILKDEFEVFQNQLNRLVPANDLIIDMIPGAGWETKFLAKDDGGIEFEPELLHVMIETMVPMMTLNLLMQRFDNFLWPNLDGTKIYVTDANNWEREYLELRFPGEAY